MKKITDSIDKIKNLLNIEFEINFVEFLNREHKAVPDNWKFIMIFTNTKSEETAMEGVLIHMLQPTVNDEIFGQK